MGYGGVAGLEAARASYHVEAVATLDEILRALPAQPKAELTPARLELDLVGLAEAAELIGIGRALSERRRCDPSFRCRWPSFAAARSGRGEMSLPP
jgi:hypothetical protein